MRNDVSNELRHIFWILASINCALWIIAGVALRMMP